MPPSIPKSSIGALARFKSSNAAISHRSFSISASLSSIGPENPRFIEIPAAVQPEALQPQKIKGVLPVPRKLFPKNTDKTSFEYIAATAPRPRSQKKPETDYVAWKREMASVRRKNLREGLVALHNRKLVSDQQIAAQSKKKSIYRRQCNNAPQRRDEHLTSPTVTEAMSKLQVGAPPDPLRAERIEAKKARVAEKEAIREEARRNALHTLYMHARDFIMTEEQLDSTINEIFVEKPFKQSNSNNIWDAEGQPKSVQEMLSHINNAQRTAVGTYSGPAVITGSRMKKISEELTGGKMD